MPPLNDFVFDHQPLLVGRDNTNDVRSYSPSSFDKEADRQNPFVKFTFPPRKSVSFNHNVDVRCVPSHLEWTEEERIARWNTDDDYTNFQLDLFNTIYLMRNDPEAIDDISQCSRGVEHRHPIVRRKRKLWKREAWDAVFTRQRIKIQSYDDRNMCIDSIASTYCHAAQAAMRSAIDFAAQDEIDANEYRNEDKENHFDDMEFFNHSWIGSVTNSHCSVSSSLSGSSSDKNDDDDDDGFGFSVLGENTGFDNSWLRLDL